MTRDFNGKSRFADAARAGHSNKPLVCHETDHLTDLVVSTDQIRGGRRQVGPSRDRIGTSGGRFRPRRPDGGRAARTDIARELIAAANDCANNIVARKSFAQGLYLRVQIVLLDNPPRPDPRHQLAFADDGTVGLDQRHEHIESASAELQRLTVGKNFAPPRHHPKRAELEAGRRFALGFHGRRLYPTFSGQFRSFLAEIRYTAPSA